MNGSLVLHIVRHGESTDNLKSLWAGWQDAPLSIHGMAQAERVGDSMSNIRIARIYSSDLKRAHWTAIQIHQRNKGSAAAQEAPPATLSELLSSTSPEQIAGPASPTTIIDVDAADDSGPAAAPHVGSTAQLPKPITTPLLREQHFGAAEGQPWSSGPYANSDWSDYRFKFEGGEALVDVGARAEEVLQRIILPWASVASQETEDVVIVLTAHGIMISQLCQALVRHSAGPRQGGHFGGLMNTSYHTFRLRLTDPPMQPLSRSDIPLDMLPPPFSDSTVSYTLQVERTGEVGHLNGLKRAKGGIGRMAHDESQAKLTSFFGGGAPSPTKRAARV